MKVITLTEPWATLVAIGATSDSTPVKGATGVMGVATYAIAPAVRNCAETVPVPPLFRLVGW